MEFQTLLKNNNNYYFRIEYFMLVNRNVMSLVWRHSSTKGYTFYQKLYQKKFVDLIKANNFALLRFFSYFTYYGQKIEFLIFNTIVLNLNEKYTSYKKML